MEKKSVGLTSQEAEARLKNDGRNELTSDKGVSFFRKAISLIAEPMFLLLIAASIVYFVLGEARDGAIMLVFVVAMIVIEIVQEWKTDKTLRALKNLSAPKVRVVRDGEEQDIDSALLVRGDVMLVKEGDKISADGTIIRCADLSVDESSLTGESLPVVKSLVSEDDYWRTDRCYAGTLVTQGSAAVEVDATGDRTEYGRIGKRVAEAPDRPTPLEKQTARLVKVCACIAAALLIAVAVITYVVSEGMPIRDRVVSAVLSGITLAMAMIPEEFPVILTVFLSLGAWRLAKNNSLVRRLPSVETLGAVSVLCVDKTGTLTQNRMTVSEVWGNDISELVEIMGLACESETYDPMEEAMLVYCEQHGYSRSHLFGGKLITEYAFTNESKMMGHVWRHDGEVIIAAKGSAERLLPLCGLDENKTAEVNAQIARMSAMGLRVIGIAHQHIPDEQFIPSALGECKLELCGVVGLYDPPRESVRKDLARCKSAGIRVVMITGDNGSTASAIARQIGLDSDRVITGDELSSMSDEELCEQVKTANIFSRVIPEHKMRIVKAFKENGEIVAMTGDGVNDAPALKYADIGVAMGMRGSEVAREAADIVLLDDNFSTIVETVRDGRRIYDNIKKAVGYVFAIHIPIALSSLFAPIFGIPSESLPLLPLHVVLLELMIDPTCSVVLERQPAESDIMSRSPRDPKQPLATPRLLLKSVIQGLVMFIASFGAYYCMLISQPSNAPLARSMGLAVLIIANIFLVQVNSSDIDSFFYSLRKLAHDKVFWLVNVGAAALLAVLMYTPLNAFVKLAPLSAVQLLIAIGLAAVSTFWYEIVKLIKRIRARK